MPFSRRSSQPRGQTQVSHIAGRFFTLATQMEDWTSLGQQKRKPEFPVVTQESHHNSRKTTWFAPLGKMRPLPATASQGKSPVPP